MTDDDLAAKDGILDPHVVPDLSAIESALEIALTDGHEWQHFDVPNGTAQVEMKIVNSGADGILALCRFPAGWRRSQQGYYDIDEVLLYLRGSMTVSSGDGSPDHTLSAGQYLFRARHDLRSGNFTEEGCLTLAWVPRIGVFIDSAVTRPEYDGSRSLGPFPVADSPWAALSSLCS
jgi:hypothetical protein